MNYVDACSFFATFYSQEILDSISSLAFCERTLGLKPLPLLDQVHQRAYNKGYQLAIEKINRQAASIPWSKITC